MKKENEKMKVTQVFIKQPCDLCGELPEDKWYIRNPTYELSEYLCPKCLTQNSRLPSSEDMIAMEKDWCIVEYKTTISRWLRENEEQTRFVISSCERRKETNEK